MRHLAIWLTMALAVTRSGSAATALEELIGPEFARQAPASVSRALEAFLSVEQAYRNGRYRDALDQLEALWRDAPPGSKAWVDAAQAGRKLGRDPGLNIGNPPCYYALRMLTDCARWRVASRSRIPHENAPHRAVLTVVLVGQSRGIQPRSMAEAEAGEGVDVVHELEPALLADDNRIIRQSLWLFNEYMLASTEGRLGVETRIVHLPEVSAKVQCRVKPRRFANLAEGAAGIIARNVAPEIRNSTDWWWLIYPSNVPEQHPDFRRTEFVTGGMGGGPDGGSPCFIVDDRWLTRKPPHIGLGPYTEIERRAYLPQWLQHEFMHHLFRTYPQFGLEVKSHQWFDRKTWPDDFEGRFEPDYYAEAMHKRLRTPQADPALHVALRYRPPSLALLLAVDLEHLAGTYRHRPVQNDWHIGEISVEKRDQDGKPMVFRWTNRAGVSWRLFPDRETGHLRTGPRNPYYNSDPVSGRSFRLVLERGPDGDYRSQLVGFRFQNGLYTKEQ